MTCASSSKASLRFSGDDLDPDDISRQLGCAPTVSARKGDVKVGKHTNIKSIERTGKWILRATDTELENLNAQIEHLCSLVTSDMVIWEALTKSYSADVFCGVFTNYTGFGFSISHATSRLLSDRRLRIEYNCYAGSED